MNSSEEVEEEEVQEDHDGTRKSYDCTFCRRGFTNAQALGGHMNIHRKDRAKNKRHLLHHSTNSSNTSNNNNHQEGEFMSLKFSSSSSSHAYSYSAFDSQRTYDNMYFHPPPQPPNDYQIRNHQQHEPPFQLDQFHGSIMMSHHQPMMNLKNQELQGANLSLQICPTSDDEHVTRRRIHQQDSDEVDLELRLGHHDP